jgi:hypothetical protein
MIALGRSTEQAPASKFEMDIAIRRGAEVGRLVKGNVNAHQNPRGLAIVGWTLGISDPVRDISVLAEGNLLARAPLDVERPDVADLFGALPDTATPGFHLILEPDGVGTGELTIVAHLDEERQIELATLRVTATPPARSLLRRALAPESPRGRTLGWTLLSPPPEREKVLQGEDGWLFLRRDSNDVLGQSSGRVRLGRAKRRGWREVLRRRMDVVQRSGVRWECVVIPDKEFVYAEHLPGGIGKAGRRPVHEFLAVAEELGAPVTYALPALEAAKAETELFPKTDSHWSQRGAFVAYRSTVRSLGAPALEEGAIRWVRAEAPGGLGMKLYPPAISTTIRADLDEHSSSLIFDNQVHNHGRVMIFEQSGHDSEGSSCVVFGESFVQNLLVFLKETFSRLVYVHTSMLVPEIIEAEEPDVVLSFPLERFLIEVPDDSVGIAGLAVTAAAKAGSGDLAPAESPFLWGVPHRDGCTDPSIIGLLPWGSSPAGRGGAAPPVTIEQSAASPG